MKNQTNARCLQDEDDPLWLIPMVGVAKIKIILKNKYFCIIRILKLNVITIRLLPDIRLETRGGMGIRRTEFFREKYCTFEAGGSSSTYSLVIADIEALKLSRCSRGLQLS